MQHHAVVSASSWYEQMLSGGAQHTLPSELPASLIYEVKDGQQHSEHVNGVGSRVKQC